MSRKRKKSPATATVSAPATPTPRSGGDRLSLPKRLAFSFLAAALALAALELALAVLGIKPLLYATDPYVGFSARIPLFQEEVADDGRKMMVTAPNKLRLFNEQRFPKAKGDRTFRIFTVGGSTTYGRPYDDATSFTGWLREFLRAGAPEREWEVINAGGVSYASYRVALLMEELIRYEPDLFIVYSGHNEFLERRTYGQVRDMPPPLRGLGLLAAKTRTGAVIQRAAQQLGARRPSAAAPATELESEVVTLLDNTIGPQAFQRDDALRAQTLRHYQFNLARLCDIARSVGAAVLFVTPASNLRGLSPFKSEHRADLPPAELARWQTAYQAGLRALTNQLPADALRSFDEAAHLDDRHAHLHFLRGHALFQLARFPEAKTAYQRARDEDVCPLRALGPMPGIVRDVAEDRGTPLVDFVALQEARSEQGIPGADVFLDHVHPTIESHRQLALRLLEVLHEQGILAAVPGEAILNPVTQQVLSRIDAERNAVALSNLSKVLGWAGKHTEAYRLASQAAALGPDLARVQYQAGLCAQLLGRREEAVDFYQRTVALDPTAAQAHGNLGVALEDLGRLDEALPHFQLALEHGDPKDAERHRRNLERLRAKLAGNPADGR